MGDSSSGCMNGSVARLVVPSRNVTLRVPGLEHVAETRSLVFDRFSIEMV